jgi:hypothetical protein
LQPEVHAPRREWSLSALVVLELIALFVVVPLVTKASVPGLVTFGFVAAIVGVVLVVVRHSRPAVAAICLATLAEIIATAYRTARPSERTEVLDFAVALVFIVAVNVVLGITLFGPGRVTIYRILGAIVIYLNVAFAFALAYRMIGVLIPGAFAGTAVAPAHTLATYLYFSFASLTTSAYGDVLAVDPIARSLTNLEAVIGQLFPATVLTRLITLELQTRGDATS